MCRLYGFCASEPTKVECTLVHAQNALLQQSLSDLAGRSHTSGWGIATFESGVPCVVKQAWAAYRGEEFRRSAAQIYSRQVLAHIRRATVGGPALANTHPFADERWALVHNGTVPGFDRIRSQLLDQLAPERRQAIVGETDSEHVFQLFRSLQDRYPRMNPRDVLAMLLDLVVGWSRDAVPEASPGLNLLLANGREMIGSRMGAPLYFVERRGVHDCEVCGFPHIRHTARHVYRALVIASEPITEEDWREVPDCSVFRVDADFRFANRTLAEARHKKSA